jgi:hypothetical protein
LPGRFNAHFTLQNGFKRMHDLVYELGVVAPGRCKMDAVFWKQLMFHPLLPFFARFL